MGIHAASPANLLSDLRSLSHNIWWSWNLEAQAIFRELSPHLWEHTHHSPTGVLSGMSERELLARLSDREFSSRVHGVVERFSAYIGERNTWASTHAPLLQSPVAYFSAELGFHESLRTYSGGLGILSGDHIKSASDLGIPFVGISLFYRQGYFEQRVAVEGWQHEQYISADPEKLPLTLVADGNGVPLRCSVEIGFSTVYFQAWKLPVGRAVVYLLDTNLPENEERFRDITAHVYGGDSSTRISQEIVLGIGGARFLHTMNVRPSTYHMNEGHSAFLTLELLREEIASNKHIREAEKAVADRCVFTTHTPVPAGHDRFSKDLMEYSFTTFCKHVGLSIEDLMSYGRVVPNNTGETFCMTVLAVKMSRAANGVSQLHGHVSREMWKELFPGVSVDQVPIGSITNGIHISSWLNDHTMNFWNRKLGRTWQDSFLDPSFWARAADEENLSDEELWSLRYILRRDLIEFVRRQLVAQHTRLGNGGSIYESVLSPDALTIGFSRRFATYKRAPLLFMRLERALELFNDPARPIQLIFAGKAHPRDDEGKKFIRKIIDLSKHPLLFGKVVFVENYDINVARHLISGSDVWLNNPRRPLEASGTSGQKIAIHGGVNCSIMDGWWREAYDGTNGWSIGVDDNNRVPEKQDEEDAENLYQVLKNQIIPEFYNRNGDNLPVRWLKRIRRSIATLVPGYNTHRMVAEYVQRYYR